MADPTVYQSLYRRYRPQRFDQVLGQDHITHALRNAVRDGRVGHAYLFSGPRGTGKTSTARILAMVLNCGAPADGEPCGVCERCQTVQRGQDIDWLLEQDAASKSKVDDMRDLLDRVPLGTSGNRKVIILDEVHMLSQGAENALLKTLEEPPSHVVFVLATTDPQKVRPTIRSRTQHFDFHLLGADLVADHVRHVIGDAELQLSPDAVPDVVDHVVRVGGGSVRDTLSALDQVAALGGVAVDGEPIDAILDAVATRDPGAALVAVADAIASGREPRALGEALMVRLRDAFLTLMEAGDDQLPVSERERARRLGDRMGAAGLTRALEVLGEALTELTRKPDPRIVVEVALVRLTRPDADRTLDAVLDRIERLERAVGGAAGAAVDSNPPTRAEGAQPGPATAAREALASHASTNPAPDVGPGEPAPDADDADAPDGDAPDADAPDADAAGTDTPDTTTPDSPAPQLDALRSAWGTVLGDLPISVRSKWRGGQWVHAAAGTVRFAVPNAWHKQACDGGRAEVERALAEHFGAPLSVEVVVEGAHADDAPAEGRGAEGGGAADPAPADHAVDDAVDPAELADAKDVPTGGVDLLVREFGGELITSDAPEDDQ